MQILHPCVGSVQQYLVESRDPDRYRPDHCPQCEAARPLTAHGFYSRMLVVRLSTVRSACAAICAVAASTPYRCYRSSPSLTSVSASQ